MLSRDDIRPEQTQMLLTRGFLPISVDYRLCPETSLTKGPMTDVLDALAWIRNELPQLSLMRKDIHVDAKKVVAVGWSTGGHLAMSLAWQSAARNISAPDAILAFYCPTDYEDSFWTTPNIPVGSRDDTAAARGLSLTYELDHDVWAGISEQPIVAYNVPPRKRALGGWMASDDARSRLALYMNWHGRTLHVLLHGLDKRSRAEAAAPSPQLIAQVSPQANIRRGLYATPTFIIHPREDDLIPWQQSIRTFEALRDQEVDADIRIVEGVPHLFDVYPEHRANEAGMEAIVAGYDFLSKHVGLEKDEYA